MTSVLKITTLIAGIGFLLNMTIFYLVLSRGRKLYHYLFAGILMICALRDLKHDPLRILTAPDLPFYLQLSGNPQGEDQLAAVDCGSGSCFIDVSWKIRAYYRYPGFQLGKFLAGG